MDSATHAERCVALGDMDLVMIGRAYLANPHYTLKLARQPGLKPPTWVQPAPCTYWLEPTD